MRIKSRQKKYFYFLALFFVALIWQNCSDSALVLPEIEIKEEEPEVIIDNTPDPIEPFSVNTQSPQVSFGQSISITPDVSIPDEDKRTLQWFHNDEAIDGATTSTLIIDKAQPVFSGAYKLQVDDFVSPALNIEVHQAKNCASILQAFPNSQSGVYVVDLDEGGPEAPINAECDMTTDNGGWMLVLNYLHTRNSQPPLNVKGTDLPVKGVDTLGVDESGDFTKWGHASPQMMSKIDFQETRFYCITNASVSRRIHFKTSDAVCKSYFQSGSGSCSNRPGFTVFADHTAMLPGNSETATAGRGLNEGNFAMTNLPIFSTGANGTSWALRRPNSGGFRWECDNTTIIPGATSTTGDTLHRIWVR